MKKPQRTVAYALITIFGMILWTPAVTPAFAINPPTLNSPGTSTSPGPTISTLTPTMSWNAVSGATGYGLYVEDVASSVLVYDNSAVGNVTSLVLPSGTLVAGHSYVWNMQASQSGVYSAYSTHYYFQEQAQLSAPTLNSPGTSTSPGPTISTLTPTMSWNAVSGATGYGLYVEDVASSVLVYDNSAVGNITSLVLPSGTLVAGHSYVWNMQASQSGVYSAYSTHYYFQEQAQLSAPALNSPGTSSSPGPTISTLTPTMSWNAVSGATGYGLYVEDVASSVLVYDNSAVGNVTSLVLPSGTLVAGHSYVWNMQASESGVYSGYSTSYYFQEQAQLSAPTLNSPGTSTSPGPTISTLTPTMSWNAVSGATGYGLYVEDVASSVLVYDPIFPRLTLQAEVIDIQ